MEENLNPYHVRPRDEGQVKLLELLYRGLKNERFERPLGVCRRI